MATISAIIEKQFNAFVKSHKSTQPHIPILVKEFDRDVNEVSFTYNGNKIKIPNGSVLSPSPKKKTLTPKDFIDYASGSVLLIIKGTMLPDTSLFEYTTICNPTLTCRVPKRSVQYPPTNMNIQGIERLEELINTLHIYLEFKP